MTDQRFKPQEGETLRRLQDLDEHLKGVFATRRQDPARRTAFLAKLAAHEATSENGTPKPAAGPRPAAGPARSWGHTVGRSTPDRCQSPPQASTNTRRRRPQRTHSRRAIDPRTTVLAPAVALLLTKLLILIKLIISIVDHIWR